MANKAGELGVTGLVQFSGQIAEDFLREMRGKEAVLAKNIAWFDDNEVHSASVTGPFISPGRFAVWYSFEWTRRASGERVQFTEVAVYTVVDGKIAHEEFLYAA